jgi:hypothetical protein
VVSRYPSGYFAKVKFKERSGHSDQRSHPGKGRGKGMGRDKD